MTSHPRRALSALVVALALAVTACSNGADHGKGSKGDSRGGAGKPGDPSSSATPNGVVPDAAAVQAALDDYTTRNNAVLAKVGRAPWNAKLWAAVDTGAILAQDRFATAADRKLHRTDKPIGFTWTALRALVPAPGDQQFLMVTTRSRPVALRPHVKLPKPNVNRKWVLLSVLQRSGDHWRNAAGLVVRSAQVPTALSYGDPSTPDAAQLSRARTLATQLTTYWRTGRKPAGFASTKWIDYPRTQRQKQFAKGFDRVDVTARPFDAGSLWVVRTAGGALVVATFKVHEISIETSPNGFGYFTGDSAAVFGSGRHDRLDFPTVVTTAFVVPDQGGAKPLGLTRNPALY